MAQFNYIAHCFEFVYVTEAQNLMTAKRSLFSQYCCCMFFLFPKSEEKEQKIVCPSPGVTDAI